MLPPPKKTKQQAAIEVRERAWRTHGKKHDGHGQRDGGQDSQTHQQQQGVKLVDLGEGVEQLSFHSTCGA